MPTAQMEPIFSIDYLARAVADARAMDRRDGTDLALQRVADLTGLPLATITETVREHAHAVALAENAIRGAKCGRDCSKCGCNKAPAGIPAEATRH